MSDISLQLPGDFLRWLKKLPEHHLVRFKTNEWQFWTPEELQESTRINTLTTTHLSVPSGFVSMYRGIGLTAAKGPGGKPFPYERLDRCLALATDNEDYLIVDPDDGHSVWKFSPDYAKCGEVKPIATSLTLFLEEASIEEAPGDDWDT